jgi:integrase
MNSRTLPGSTDDAQSAAAVPPRSVRLLGQVRERARYLHYSLATEKAYIYWIRFFIRWSGMKHPRDMGSHEVESFLTMLATQRRVSTSTHNQALSSLLFLYREVLCVDLPWLTDLARPTRARRLPSVLTRDEVASLLASVSGEIGLVAHLLYGTGMRLMEALRLRVKDVDFERHAIIVREAKGNKDRVVMLPRALVEPMRLQLRTARHQGSRAFKRQRQACLRPHAAPLFRHTPAAGRHGHSHRTGAARPLRREHHHDLHARAQDRCGRHVKPARCVAAFGERAAAPIRVNTRIGSRLPTQSHTGDGHADRGLRRVHHRNTQRLLQPRTI